AILELLHSRLTGNAVPDLDEAAHGPVRGYLGKRRLGIKVDQACRLALVGFLSAGVSRDAVVGVDCECAAHVVSPLPAASVAVITFITPVARTCKRILTGFKGCL